MGIKKQEETILKKAKEETKKIEEYKNKFRQSAMGGVITNKLINMVEKFDKK